MKSVVSFFKSIITLIVSAYGIKDEKNYILRVATPQPVVQPVVQPSPAPKQPAQSFQQTPSPTKPSDQAKPDTSKTDTGGTVLMPVADDIKKGIRIVQVASLIGLASGLGFAYYRKSKVWGYIGWGLLGSFAFSAITGVFAVKKGINVFKKDIENAGAGSSTAPTNEEKTVYQNAVTLGKKMGNEGKMPSMDEFLKRYRTFNATEKTIFSEYMAGASKIDYTNMDKAFGEMAKVGNDLATKYGEETVKKVLA